MGRATKIVIVDDHGLMREGLVAMLDGPEFEVIASLSSGEAAVNFVAETPPDLLLMDIVMKGMTGIEAVRWVKEQNPQVKIILISSEVNKEYISAGIKSGIEGYLPKDVDKETLVQAISKVMAGEKHFSPEISALVFEDFYLKETRGKGLPSKKIGELTKREEEVLVQIANGLTLKEVADVLFVSVKTIETHKIHIQDKLGLSNTAQLVRYAIERDLVKLEKKK